MNLQLAAIVAQEAETPSGGLVGFLLPLVIIGGLFYVLLVLPQRRRMRKIQEVRDSVSVGDEVRTVGGIYGRVTAIDESTITLDVGGTQIKFAKAAIAEQVGDEEESA